MIKKVPASADYEYIKEKSRLFYNDRIKNDVDFYKAEKVRVKEYKKNRYANDPEYRERIKEKSREIYEKKKLKKLELEEK